MFFRFIIILFAITAPFSVQIHAQETVNTGRIEAQTTSTEILGAQTAAEFESILKPDKEIKWSMYIPKNYDPASPPGIIVHMTQNNLAKMPFGWASAMDEKNMIWISLNKAGNLIRNKEMFLAVLATPFVQSRYKIDINRIYIVASADSCYPASAAMEVYPNIFKGIIYSTCEPINWKSNTPKTIEKMKENRYLFVSSNEKDIKRVMRRAYRKYTDAGITKIEYINIPKLVYGRQIDRRKLIQSIGILDSLN